MKKILNELDKVSKSIKAGPLEIIEDVDWDTYDAVETVKNLYDKMADEYKAKTRDALKTLNRIEDGKSNNRKIKAWLKKEIVTAKNTGKYLVNEIGNAESSIS